MFKPSLLFCILSSTLTDVQKPTRRSRSRRPLLPLPKTRNRGRSRCAFSPARVLKERSTMLARAASSGGGTRDSPSSRRPSRIKMLTPEEDKELQVRAVPSAMRGLPGVLKVDAQSIIVLRGTKRARIRDTPARSRASHARGSIRERDRARPPSFPSQPSAERSPPPLLSSLVLSFWSLLREY